MGGAATSSAQLPLRVSRSERPIYPQPLHQPIEITIMDQQVRMNELGAEGTLESSNTTGGARRLRRTGAALGMAAVLVVFWSGLAAHRASAKLEESTHAAALITVATTQPAAQSQLSELILPGNIQANYEAPIYARTSGYLKRWLVDIGTPVKAGH